MNIRVICNHCGNFEYKRKQEVAKEQGKTIKDFILEAIKEKIEKWEKGE